MGFISGEYGDSFCDLIEVQPHCLRVDVRQDQPCGSTTGGTSGTEDIALLVTFITRCAGAGYAPHPFARKCSLLPNTGFILEPYLKGLTLCMFWHELDYEAGKVFESLLCCGISFGMLRSNREATKSMFG